MRVYNSLQIAPSAESTLSQGSRSPSVIDLQQGLVNAGFDPKGVDGAFGPATHAAVVAFQQANGLVPDGVVGMQTWRALAAKGNGQAPQPVPAQLNRNSDSFTPSPVANRLPGSGATGNAAAVAQQFLGMTEYQLQPSGKLDMDTWVPKNVDCANFVSGCLEKAGLIGKSQRSDSVKGLAGNLRQAGWQDVSLAQARPGDVVCFDGPEGNYQHVEIFNGMVNGKPQFIGSNNVLSDGTQKITLDSGSWARAFHILHKP